MANAIPKLPQITILNLPVLLRFFKSVALAVAQNNHIHVVWREYKESSVLNALYAIMPWKDKPGFVEVEVNHSEIIKQSEFLTDKFVSTFMVKAKQGSAVALKYLEELQTMRESSLEFVRETFRSASEINNDVIGAIDQGVRSLQLIKAGSQLIIAGTVIVTSGGALLAGLGLGSSSVVAALAAPAAGVSATSFGFSISKAIVEGWHTAGDSQILAIAGGERFYSELANNHRVTEPGGVITESTKEGVQRLAAAGTSTALLASGKYADRVNHLKGAAAEYERQLANARTANRQAKLAARLASRQNEMTSITQQIGTKAAAAGAFLGIIFAGKDAYDAICEINSVL